MFHFLSPNFFEGDSLYYLRLAWLYRTRGLLDAQFPWLPYSAIAEFSSSLWYGFGVLLIPFTAFEDPVLGIKVAGVLLTGGALWTYYLVARRMRLRMAPLWPCLLFFSAPNVLAVFLMVRPQVVTLALAPLLFCYLAQPRNVPGETARSDDRGSASATIPIFLISLANTWVHLNFAWIVGFIAAVVVSVRWVVERRVAWRAAGAVAAGMLLGWLLRPNPLGAARLLYIQLVELLFAKWRGIPLLFGNENLPLDSAVFLRNFVPLAVLWAVAGAVLIWRTMSRPGAEELKDPDRRVLLWASFLLSVASLLVAFVVGRRTYSWWSEFGIILIASVYTDVVPSSRRLGARTIETAATWAIVGVLVFVAFDSTTKTSDSFSHSGIPPDRLKTAGRWLEEHSRAGDIVFNVRWFEFSPLFFWNQKSFYVGGLDPIFQYAHDPRLYWKFHHLSGKDSVEFTCGVPVCSDGTREDTHDVLVKDFKARYVVVGKRLNPDLYRFFAGDPRFEQTVDTPREAVFRIRRSRP